jgi:hypothetical protein
MAMWTCPKCQAKVDVSFEVCWRCGTSADGLEDPTFVCADDVGPILDPPVIDEALEVEPLVKAITPPNPFGPEVDLVEAYTAEDRMQAHFLAEELTNMGIPAVADSHEPNELFGGLDALPKVWVRVEDYARARAWLQGYEMTLREGHPARDE